MKKSKKHQNGPRRVSGAQRLEWPVIEGLERAAVILGAPLAILKQLKRSNCKAFLRGGRVDTGILVPAVFAALIKGSTLPEGMATPQDWLATEKAKREAIRRQQDEALLMPIADARRQNGEAWGFVFGELERLCNEAPPDFAGRTAIEILDRLTKFKETMRRDAKRKFEPEQ